MPYPYGMQNSPVVGNGLGGLPRRTSGVTPSTTPVGGVPYQTLGIIPRTGYSNGYNLNFNNVLYAFSGGQQTATRARVNVSPKNLPPFTLHDGVGGISGFWPSLSFMQPSNTQPNLVSLTHGGDSGSTTNTYFYGFAPDYIYYTRSTTTNGNPFGGFWLDGEDTSIYLFYEANITKYAKSDLSTQLASKLVSGASATITTMAWIYGNTLSFFDQNGTGARLVNLDKDTLAITSQFSTPTAIQAPPNNVAGMYMTQTSKLVAFVTGGKELVVLDKATQNMKYYTLDYSNSGSVSQAYKIFAVGDDICLMQYSYDGASIHYVEVFKVTFDNITYIYNIYGGSMSADYQLYPASCYLASDVVTIPNIAPTTQSLIYGGSAFSFKMSNAATTTMYPSAGLTQVYSGSVRAYTGNVTKTTIATVSVANGNPNVITPKRYPYQINL